MLFWQGAAMETTPRFSTSSEEVLSHPASPRSSSRFAVIVSGAAVFDFQMLWGAAAPVAAETSHHLQK